MGARGIKCFGGPEYRTDVRHFSSYKDIFASTSLLARFGEFYRMLRGSKLGSEDSRAIINITNTVGCFALAICC